MHTSDTHHMTITTTRSVNVASRPVASIVIVRAPACHFCADADEAIAAMTSEFLIAVTYMEVTSDEGMNLMQAHGAGMSPLVLLDGGFVSSGRLSRGRLRKMLNNGGYRRELVSS